VAETVIVEGATTQVETTSAAISALVAPQQMQDLPLNGRDFEQLILLAPGVQTVTTEPKTLSTAESLATLSPARGPRVRNSCSTEQTSRGFGITAPATASSGLRWVLRPLASFRFSPTHTVRGSAERERDERDDPLGNKRFSWLVYDFLRNDVFDARDYLNTIGSPQSPIAKISSASR